MGQYSRLVTFHIGLLSFFVFFLRKTRCGLYEAIVLLNLISKLILQKLLLNSVRETVGSIQKHMNWRKLPVLFEPKNMPSFSDEEGRQNQKLFTQGYSSNKVTREVY